MSKKRCTFAAVAKKLLNQKKYLLQETTYKHMQFFFEKKLVPYFGKMEMRKITPNVVNSYFSFVLQEGKRKTLSDDIKYLKMALRYSYYEGTSDRLFPIRNPDPEPSSHKLVYLWQFKILLNDAIRLRDEDLTLMLLMAFVLGLRPKEYCQCETSFILFELSMIKYPPIFLKTRRMGDREVPIPAIPKGKRAKRLGRFTVRCIRLLRNLLKKKVQLNNKYLFPSPVNMGRPIVDIKSKWRRWMKTLQPKLKTWITPYDLRHSKITNLVRSNVHTLKIRAICGVSPRTMARYSHVPIKELGGCVLDSFDEAA